MRHGDGDSDDAAGVPPVDGGGVPPDRFADEVVASLPSLERFARTLVRDDAAADDLVQETVARALERRAGFRGGSSVQTWLHRILFHLAVDRHRRERRSEPSDTVTEQVEARWRDDGYTVDAAVVVERAEVRERLEDALVRLPFDQRVAVVLHDIEGLTVREIAEVAGIGLAAAKQRLRRGRMAMVSALADGAERAARSDGVPLRCWDARARVSEYLDGELPDGHAAALEAHLAGCPTCPPLYAALTGTAAALGRLRDPDSVVDPAVAARIRGKVGGRRDP